MQQAEEEGGEEAEVVVRAQIDMLRLTSPRKIYLECTKKNFPSLIWKAVHNVMCAVELNPYICLCQSCFGCRQ